MAFGDNPFGDNRPRVNQRGRGGGGGGGGSGGGNNRNRNRNKNRNRGAGGAEEPPVNNPSVANAFTQGDVSSGDPYGSAFDAPQFDSTFGGAGSIFEDPVSAGGESWRQNALGILNQAGIAQDNAFGQQQRVWLDDQLQDWNDQWKGQAAMSGDDAGTWIDYMFGIPGTPPPGAGQTNTFTTAGTPGTEAPDWKPWVREQTGKGVGSLNKGRRQRLRDQYALLGEDATPGTASSTVTAPTLDWIRNTYGPEMQRYLTARYQSQTPRGRGTDTTRWGGPRRVIQF